MAGTLSLTIGIDPGIRGAIALLDASRGELQVFDVPVHETKKNGRTKATPDMVQLASMLDDWATLGVSAAAVEMVSPMPKQGITSSFNFGMIYGALQMALAAQMVPYELIHPSVWKKDFKLLGQTKDASRQRASELMPRYGHYWRRKKDDGRAEAALLAYWAAMKKGEPAGEDD